MGEFGGFAVRGFRSFHGDTQYIPLGEKATALVGHNNSGKSSIVAAALHWLPILSSLPNVSQGLGYPTLLDRPIVDETATSPLPLIGVALKVADSRLDSLAATLPDIQINGAIRDILTIIADSPALRPTKSDSTIWFRWTASSEGRALQYDSQVIDEISASISPRERALSNFCLDVFSRAGGVDANIAAVLDRWARLATPPPVAFVPAVRHITDEGAAGPTLVDTSGKGLPKVLQAWQAPSADRHRTDSRKFRRLNEFIRGVLEDRDAEVTVPYDSTTIHVSLGGQDRPLPLQYLGSGVSQIVLLAALATWHDNHLVCIEEIETNLHPTMLRKLLQYLICETTNKYILTTHSAHVLDDPSVGTLQVRYEPTAGTSITNAITRSERAAISRHLGYRASDLMQSNAIIWVEGPSDRVYVRHWLHLAEARLTEGVHYSIMFYGGRLLAHLTGEEMDTPADNLHDFIKLLDINRHMGILIDSDKRHGAQDVNKTKLRIQDEFMKSDSFCWVTTGREIENYIPAAIFDAAVREVHPTTSPDSDDQQQFASRFESFVSSKPAEGKVVTPSKVQIAEKVIARQNTLESSMSDFRSKVDELARFLRAANGIEERY